MLKTAHTTRLNSIEIIVQLNEMTVQAQLKMVMADTGVKGQNVQVIGTYLKIPAISVTGVDNRELA